MKKENFIWTIPPAGIFIFTLIAILLQACTDRGQANPTEPVVTLETLQNSLTTAWKVYYLTLFVGGVFSAFIYYQVWRLTRKLRRMGHNV